MCNSVSTDTLPQRSEREMFRARAAIMKALAHPSRLMIIDELSYGERSVRHLTRHLGYDISTVSKHLKLMKKHGLVESDKRGKQVFYRLKVPYILNLFHCIDTVIPEESRRREQLDNE